MKWPASGDASCGTVDENGCVAQSNVLSVCRGWPPLPSCTGDVASGLLPQVHQKDRHGVAVLSSFCDD